MTFGFIQKILNNKRYQITSICKPSQIQDKIASILIFQTKIKGDLPIIQNIQF